MVPVCADASDRTQIADLVRQTVDELGSLDGPDGCSTSPGRPLTCEPPSR